MVDKKYWMWLSSINGIGSKRFFKLLDYFGTAQNVFESSEKELSESNILSNELIKVIIGNRKIDKVDNYYKKVKDNDIKVHTTIEDEYPENLKSIYDAPPVIYVKGELKPEDVNAIGIVGSRKASDYGLKAAEKLSMQLVEAGITVVSGMALGIDSAAHKGAMKAGGRTVAVFGCGLSNVYPASGMRLFEEISRNGAVISEYPLGMKALPKNFVARNRIISGMSMGVIVVEAGERSGSLITSDFALEQGREVFAVPGNINSPNSRGTNMLIKSGAKLVQDIGDVFEEFNIDIVCSGHNFDKHKKLDSIELAIVESLKKAQLNANDLISETGYPSGRVMSALTMLELETVIQSNNGQYYLV